jgi:hypothetical protein
MRKFILLLLISSFCYPDNKIQKSGYLIYKLIDENELYFIEDTSFFQGKKNKYSIKTTKIIYHEEDHPFRSPNYEHFKIKKYKYTGSTKSYIDSFYYSPVVLDAEYFYKDKGKRFYQKLHFNSSILKIIFYDISVAKIQYK